jgi:hypothetical protein
VIYASPEIAEIVARNSSATCLTKQPSFLQLLTVEEGSSLNIQHTENTVLGIRHDPIVPFFLMTRDVSVKTRARRASFPVGAFDQSNVGVKVALHALDDGCWSHGLQPRP